MSLSEEGLYLAADLGGTNFRVCSVNLNGDTTFKLSYTKVTIPKELMVAKTAEELFAFLAKQIEEYLELHHPEDYTTILRKRQTSSDHIVFEDEEVFQLGFTFSFPVQQVGINKGKLIRWTKGFDIPDAIGKDVCSLLQQEIDKLRLPVRVATLVNDTVSTLMARSYTSPGKTRTLLGAIFGTGTNGAYIEKLNSIHKPIAGDYDRSTGEMVLNTEWGSFDNQLNFLPSTSYDRELNLSTPNPGTHMFEKHVSGMFLGELVRLVVLDMMRNPNVLLFGGIDTIANDKTQNTRVDGKPRLQTVWGLDTAILSIAAADNTPELGVLREQLEGMLDIHGPSLADARAFKEIAGSVARRAARLSAIPLAAIMIHCEALTCSTQEPVDIGVDGSVIEHYPFYLDMVYESLRAVNEIGKEGADRVRVGFVKDGSSVGAALIALVAGRIGTVTGI
ncbi:hypothetical protein FSARC_1624 [Fusarium sarcochroum]|uniref:Phosphotransferase n=1 Tax=Fusarium sarcochroum TaxID=1208366 RepID=A0A8H4U8P0_9HYPO|nr:hypothetical protein FSARC_1624 [Fusarium sarcochroum]